MSGEDHSSPVAPVCPVSGAVSGARRLGASAAPACTSHGAVSVGEQPEASAADPMPNIFGGLYSSSEEGAEVILQHAPLSPIVAAPPPAPEEPEAVLTEQALAARSSSIPPPTMPRAVESRPSGPSPHDRAGTSS